MVASSLQLLSSYFWGANEEGLRLKETVPLAVHYRRAGSVQGVFSVRAPICRAPFLEARF